VGLTQLKASAENVPPFEALYAICPGSESSSTVAMTADDTRLIDPPSALSGAPVASSVPVVSETRSAMTVLAWRLITAPGPAENLFETNALSSPPFSGPAR
jgi:hypothetical protein